MDIVCVETLSYVTPDGSIFYSKQEAVKHVILHEIMELFYDQSQKLSYEGLDREECWEAAKLVFNNQSRLAGILLKERE